MTARAPVYIDSGKLHVFEDGDTLPPWLSPSSMAWANLTGVPAGITQLASLTGPGYAKVDAAGAWSVQAAIPQADVSGLTTALAGLQPISARLTAIAGLTDTAGWLHDDGSGMWSISVPTKSDVGLGNVENTALSTWGGSANLATLGTVASGIWHGTPIADAYISSAATWNAKEGGLGNPSTSGYLLSSTSAGVRSWVAPYSLPTATASVLGGVKVGAGLAISSGALSVAYGTTAGTACVGNDSRLSDSRTPTAHALDGALHTISGKTAGQVLVATGATTFGFATISGDAALSGAGELTLATVLDAGNSGDATHALQIAHDIKGRIIGISSLEISIPHTQINDWSTATSGFQTSLGFTPVQQGGGTSMGGNKVYIGWGTDLVLRLQVDTTNFGYTWPIGISGTAAYASSVAWTNVTGRPTALSSFTNDSGYLTANQSISLTGAITGSGTTSITTSFANTHLSGINQDLTTTSSPTFNYLTLTNRLQINSSQWGAGISQDGQQCDVIGYYSAWDANKLFINTYNNGVGYGAARFSGVYLHGILTTPEGISTTTLTVSGLITANGGITGNLTGNASLDIPLTGSSAITGSLISSNASDLGSASLPWGSVYGTTLYEGGVALSSKYLSSSSSSSSNLYGLILNNGGLSVQGTSLFMNKVTMQDDLTACYIKSWTITPRNAGNDDLGSGSAYWWGTYTNRLFCAIDLNAPSTATDVGIAGRIVFGSSYIYVCTATNTWRRAALATW